MPLHTTGYGEAGPRVVLLHGLFGQGRNFTGVAKALADRSRVLLVDLPNHGRSGWTAEVSYPAMADQLADLLEQTSNGQPWAVVGHSMGGKVAMTLALNRPQLVERLCVVDISPTPSRTVTSFDRYVAALRSIDLGSLTGRADADAELSAWVPEASIRGFLLQNLRREGSGAAATWRWQMNLEVLGDQLDTIGGWPDLDVAAYPGPVLWLAGADSGYVTQDDVPLMRALFPRVRLVRVKGAGHWVHSDQPEVFVATLRRFLHPQPTTVGNPHP